MIFLQFRWIYCMILVALALPIQASDNDASSTPAEQPLCGFEGNSDIYGLGIRLGLYLQWLSAYLVCQTLPESIPDLIDVTFIFEFALFVATVVLAATASATYSIELVVLIIMYLADLWLVHVPVAVWLFFHPTAGSVFSIAGVLARTLMSVAMSVFAVWVAMRGYNNYLVDYCGTYIFLFAKIRMRGRRLWGVSSANALRGISCLNVALVFGLSADSWRIVLAHVRRTSWQRLSMRELARNIFRAWQLPLEQQGLNKGLVANSEENFWFTKGLMRFVLPFLMALAITTIELILNWNSITSVYSIKSTGQLIPFVLGVGGLFRVMNQAFTNHLVQIDTAPVMPLETLEQMQLRIVRAIADGVSIP